MKIVSLEAENVKRLKAVHISPDGSMVVIGGNNGNGKSSVLDSIAYAIGGKDLLCEEPVRRGQKSARVRCDLGEYVVTRTFTPGGGGSLKVVTADGTPVTSPQTVLNNLIGSLAFDPLAFSLMKAKEQAETLRRVVGLDTTDIDRRRKSIYDERTLVNRDAERLKAGCGTLDESAPEAEINIVEITNAVTKAIAHNRSIDDLEQKIANNKTNIEKARGMLAAAEAALATNEAALAAMESRYDVTAIQAEIADAEKANNLVRGNAAARKSIAELKEVQEKSAKMTREIEALDQTKADLLANAKFPVEGLGVSDVGVTMGGLPFDQASGAERLRASVAIAIAMNPKLRVMLIRDGSLLDESSLALVATMAAEHDAQVWIERVGKGAECSVVIEDGAVEEGVSS